MLISADQNNPKRYAPIPIGNGDLSLMIDYSGGNDRTDPTYSLHRAGIRQQAFFSPLFPFGRITQKYSGNSNEVIKWSQSLDTANGLISCRIVHKNGASLESRVFCHLEKNVIAFHKIRRNTPGIYTFRFECGDAPRMRFEPCDDGLRWSFDGLAEYQGTIHFLSDIPLHRKFENGVYSFSTSAEEFTFFMVFDEPDLPAHPVFDELLAESAEAWKPFWNEAYVKIPDEELMKTYEVSRYHLRINQTRWSMPVGLFNTHFAGHYFAFDEFFCAHALASCGHFSLLKKIIDFRYEGLPWAKYRANGYYHNVRKDARWAWETLEDFEEGCLPGHWQDHIFHMAHIALETWYYCCYSGDREYLRQKGLAILEACAEFYMNQAVISLPDGRKIITKCCDLERLGPGRENAYLTTCGVMATLQVTAECFIAENYCTERAAEYLETIKALRQSLPQDENFYFAVPGNEQRSVAVLGGIYPYDSIMGFEDEKQRRTIFDFMENDAEFGSMYPHAGKKGNLCCWYAAWESIVLSRYGLRDKACEILRDKAESTGIFGQIYELYSVDRLPWFATGEGIFIQAVNELFLPNGEKGQGKPPWENYSFKLRSRNGECVEEKTE